MPTARLPRNDDRLPYSRLLQFRVSTGHPTVDIFGGILTTNEHIRLQEAHGIRVLNGNRRQHLGLPNLTTSIHHCSSMIGERTPVGGWLQTLVKDGDDVRSLVVAHGGQVCNYSDGMGKAGVSDAERLAVEGW